MARLSLHKNWWRIAGVLALPSCMVSFNDYPVGPLGEGKPEGGANASGTSTGGSASPMAGSESGGTVTVMGGTSAGNNTSGSGGASAGTGATSGTAGSQSGGTDVGGTATGGTSPVGGTDPTAGGVPSDGGAPTQVESPMIDDFEDGDGKILLVSGRSGSWYTNNDGTDVQTPKAGDPLVPTKLNPARGSSLFAARITGGTFDTWGSLFGTPLSVKNNAAYPYDLSGYKGIRFWARNVSNAWNAARKLRVAFPMTGTVPTTGCTTCNDHFGLLVDVGANWAQVNVPFSLLKQQGSGSPQLPAPPDMKHVIYLEINVSAHVVYDLYIDDVELY